ncbi:MAG: hypothetical protein KKE66_17175, partial [Gammaproteobacteria bacterium]|nr:hypothetical protein [Gammaproteobacteria bacterium]
SPTLGRRILDVAPEPLKRLRPWCALGLLNQQARCARANMNMGGNLRVRLLLFSSDIHLVFVVRPLLFIPFPYIEGLAQ